MLAQLVERALSMCKVRSSTLLHSTIFFCCCGVGGVLRGAKNNNTASLIQRRQIYDEFVRKRCGRLFFYVRILFLTRSLLFTIVTILRRATYYYYVPTRVLPSIIIIIIISIIHTILLYLSRVVLFDVPVAQKRRHSERKVGWIFFYVKLEIFLQTFRLFLPGRVVFVQRNRTLRLVVVKQ